MKKKLMIFILLLLSFSLSFIICFNITKFNIAKDNQYINNIEDNEVIQSERNDQIEETNELNKMMNDLLERKKQSQLSIEYYCLFNKNIKEEEINDVTVI